MRILVGCEESQAVTLEFDKLGHFANSCDIQECSGGRPDLHYRDSIFHVLHKPTYAAGLDLFIAHPPCTYLANSGVRWLISSKPKEGYEYNEQRKVYVNKERWAKMVEAAIFFRSLLYTNCERICIENPIMHKYALEIIGVRHSQLIQPWQFGHGETKATCLWLKGLPRLKPTDIVEGREQNIWKMPPSADRQKLRSKTFPGIARAMSEQWG
jgi:hypothetical protein